MRRLFLFNFPYYFTDTLLIKPIILKVFLINNRDLYRHNCENIEKMIMDIKTF